MKNLTLRSALFLLLACCVLAGAASANSLPLLTVSRGSGIAPSWPITSTVAFPTAGDAFCAATSGCGTIAPGGQTDFMWTAGDYVVSAVFALQGPAAVGLSANWSFQDFLGNYDGNPTTETWFVFVNGVPVAAVVLPDDGYNGDIGTVTGSVTFAPIAAVNGGYQVALVLQNSLGFGLGSAAWLDGGSTGITTVPEPGSLMLLGSGALGLAGLLRRKLGK